MQRLMQRAEAFDASPPEQNSASQDEVIVAVAWPFAMKFAKRPAGAAIEISQAIVNSALDAVITMDEDGRITSWNAQAEAIFGWPAGDAVGRPLSETIIPPRQREAHRRGLERFLATGEGALLNRRIEITALHRDGHEFPVELATTPMRIRGKVSFFSFLRDIAVRKQAEQMLQDSEARYRSLSELSSDWYWEQDAEFRFKLLSGIVAHRSGNPVTGVIGSRRWELPGRVPLSGSWEEHRAMVEAHLPFRDLEYAHTNPAGEVQYISVSGEPQFDAEGRFTGYRGVGHNITARKRAELLLRTEHAELEQVYATVPAGLALVDRDLRFVRINEQLAAINGMPVADHIGRSVREVIPKLADFLEPIYRNVLETGRPQLNVNVHGTTPADPDTERDWLASYYPQLAEDDTVSGVGVFVVEVTEQERAQVELQAREAHLSMILRSAYDVIFVIEVEPPERFRFASVNPRFLEVTGLAEHQVVGKLVEEVIPEPSLALVLGNYREAIRTGRIVHWEEISEYPGGRKVGQVTVTPVFDANGTCVQLIGTVYDLTELKQAERRLQHYSERLRAVSSMLVDAQENERASIARELHDEVGQGLTAVLLNLQNVKQKVKDRAAAKQLASCIATVDTLFQQTHNLSLTLRPPQLDLVGLEATLREHLQTLATAGKLKHHFKSTLKRRGRAPQVDITCFRVVQEAVTNVIRHARATEIWVDAEQSDDEIRLCIRDDGEGFATEPAQSPASGRLGLLGMRERVELLGGSLAITSSRGEATKLIATIPLGGKKPAGAPAGGTLA
jgi:PAS domain S-box-containing protein